MSASVTRVVSSDGWMRPGRVHHQRDALQVHPHRGVAGGAVERHQVARLRRVVRAVVGSQHQLQLARPARVIRAAHQLHVLGAQVARHRVLDRHRVGERRRACGAAERAAHEQPREAAEPGERQEPAASRVGRAVLGSRSACATRASPARSPSTRARPRWQAPCCRGRPRRTPRRRRAARTGATSVGFRISRPLDSVRASGFGRGRPWA